MNRRFPEFITKVISHPLLLGCVAAGSLMLGAYLPAGATSVRITSLGGTGDYFEDDGNVLRWYGSLIDYPDRLIIQSGRFDLSDGYHSDWGQNHSGPGTGIHAAFDQSGRWGTGAMYFHGQSLDSDPGTMTDDNLEGSITLLYARSLGFGDGSLYIRHTSDQVAITIAQWPETYVYSLEQSRTDLGGGLRMDLSESAYLDVSGEIRRTSHHHIRSGSTELDDTGELVSWNNWGLRTRAFVRLSERLVLVPLAEYLREDHANGSLWSTPPYNQDGHLWRVGTGLNFFSDTDHMLLASVDYQDGQLDNATLTAWDDPELRWGEDRQVLAFVLGFEARLKSWLSFRAASGYQHYKIDRYESPSNVAAGPLEVIDNDSDHIPMSLGLGFHLQDIDLDLTLTDRQPLPLANFLYDPDQLDQSTWLSLAMRYLF